MKSYLSLIASLFLLSASCSSSVAEIEDRKITQSTEISDRQTETIAAEIDPYIKENIAPEISVKISSADNGGSGVIIAQQDNTYLVLTNNHVLRDGSEFTIDTHDGVTHQATEVDRAIATDDDLALLQFTSDKDYQTATINTAATPKAEQAILAVGYSAETGELVTESGKIGRVPDKPLKEGYQIGYTSNIVQGMSGGAILNTDGEVIGINGKSAFPIVNTGYSNEDGTKPSAEEIEQLRQLSWGLAINRLLARVNPEIITAYNLPLPETTDSIESPPLTGWLGELEAKAKQITVRIDSSSGANGSGVVVAKEGNTYAVLTADHVICEKDDERKCIDYTYEIVAPDGKKYSVDSNTINRQEGVDLAVVKFTSNENYQVAELANYPVTGDDAVFVAGYPKLNKNTPAQWLFSLGFGLEREQGLLQVTDNSLSTDSSGLTSSQGSLSGGYEMVYTSITYGGMSGGAVLDRDGRVIGIHGLAEGQTALDSQNSSATKIQFGFSLGIPVNTFIGLADRLKIDSALPIDNRPPELNPAEIETFQTAILGADIPQDNATAENWLKRGNQLWRLGRSFEAVEAFDQAIALKPKFIHLAYYGKGLALGYENEDEAALASLELAIETKLNFAPAFLIKSTILQKLNRLDEAFIAIEKAIALQKDNAYLYSEKGYILEESGQLNEAEIAYGQAIKLAPRSGFYNNRGVVNSKNEKSKLALADYNRALEINPNFASAYLNRGVLYQKQGKIELALADYNRALEINPNLPQAYSNRGLLYYEQGKIELAIADYNRALEIDPRYVSAYNNRGGLYDQQGKTELALADYNRALEIDPKDAQIYFNRGVLYQKQGKTELALADYNRALEIDPRYASAYGNRGLLYQKQGKIELAIADYNQFVKPNPQNATVYGNLGLLYKQMGNIEEARSNFKKAQQLFIAQGDTAGAEYTANLLKTLEQTPTETASNTSQNEPIDYNNAETYLDPTLDQHENNEVESAIDNHSKTIELNPNNEKALIDRGLLYQSLREYELAIEDFNRVIKINPNNPLAYINRSVVYFIQEEYELSQSDYNHAIKLDPNVIKFNRNESIDPKNAQAYYDRGFNYHQKQEYDLALADYSQAIELDSSNEKAFINRGLVYAQQGENRLAWEDYNKAIAINPNNSASYRNRGVLYFEQSDYEYAEADWDKAIEVNSEDAQAYYNRGLLHKKQGKTELAKIDLREAHELSIAQDNTVLAKKVIDALQSLS